MVKNCLHYIIKQVGNKWINSLFLVTWGLRDVPNSTTGFSPTQLVYGRQGRGPLQVLKEAWSDDNFVLPVGTKDAGDYLMDLRDRLAVAARLAELNSAENQAKYCSYANKRAKHKVFEVGQQVIVFERSSSIKLLSEWIGPCTIIDKCSDNSYMLDMPNGGRSKFHTSKMRLYHTDYRLYR